MKVSRVNYEEGNVDNLTVEELAKTVGMTNEVPKVTEILGKMEQVRITRMENNKIVISSLENLEKFIRYLEMKEQFGL